jgi:hypothetical protein
MIEIFLVFTLIRGQHLKLKTPLNAKQLIFNRKKEGNENSARLREIQRYIKGKLSIATETDRVYHVPR